MMMHGTMNVKENSLNLKNKRESELRIEMHYFTLLVSGYFILYCSSRRGLSYILFINTDKYINSRSQWPRGLRRRSVASRLLRSWVRIPPRAWMFVCCECCVLSGWGICDELITRPEESYRLWCVVVCDLENLKTEEAMTRVGSQRHKKSIKITWLNYSIRSKRCNW
jgi:hypothetical protein